MIMVLLVGNFAYGAQEDFNEANNNELMEKSEVTDSNTYKLPVIKQLASDDDGGIGGY